MKPVQIVLLVIAGALGGAVVTKLWQKRPAAPALATVAPLKSAPVAQSAPAAVQPPAAVPVEKNASAKDAGKPSPVANSGAKPASPVRTQAPARTEAKEATKPAAAAVKNRAGHGPAPPPAPVKAHKNPPPAHPRSLDLGQPAAVGQSVPSPLEAQVSPKEMEPQPLVVPPLRSEPAAEPAAAPPEPVHQVTLNAGTMIPVRLVDGLSSDRNVAGDTFAATLDHELVVDGWVIAERGAVVEGRVVTAERGSKVKGNAAITVELTRIHMSDGQTVRVQTDSFERRAQVDHSTDAAKVGGGAAIGAIIGAIAGGGKGAAIGAGAGGAVGAGDVVLTRKPATLPSETRIPFRLRAPVTVTERRG
jgi:hypothetical protein